MATNHKPMSQTERGFWREAFKVAESAYLTNHPFDGADAMAAFATAQADAAVQAYRNRITWRPT